MIDHYADLSDDDREVLFDAVDTAQVFNPPIHWEIPSMIKGGGTVIYGITEVSFMRSPEYDGRIICLVRSLEKTALMEFAVAHNVVDLARHVKKVAEEQAEANFRERYVKAEEAEKRKADEEASLKMYLDEALY